jgi:hypothetical protein
MNPAQGLLAELAAWIASNSAPRTTPLGGSVLVGPWAMIVPCDLAQPPQPAEFDPEALLLFCPAAQAAGISLPAIDTTAPASQDHAFDRLCHLLFRIGDGTLPRAAVVLLTDPTEAPDAAIARASLADLDLTAVPLLMPPVWAFSSAQRSEIAKRCASGGIARR